MKKTLSKVAFVSAIMLTSLPSFAETTTLQEFGAINKISSLCRNFSNPSITIIYDEASEASVVDKDAIIGYAKTAGKTATAVQVANIASVNDQVVILTAGLTDAQQTDVTSHLATKQVITVSTDLKCVNSSKCVLGVNVGSVVELLVSSSAYGKTGLKFDPAFEFMVKKI